ncbi:MAG TPA: tripartite tricarboxylate transporter substrate binding protein [Burkholderiales bacterium]|nr:tripartite tricarboxylate transporter substrate binding protein [Burkholderiales bacterium]
MPYCRVLFTLFTLCATFSVAAQNYPAKTIRLVSPFPPGGSVDVVGRILAAKLTENLGQQVIVDNRSGASGIIGTELVAKAPPDGYTLLINTLLLVTNEFLMPRMPYDPIRDFEPISMVTSSPSLVTVHPSVPARSVKELIALAKSKPGQLNYSAAGVGTNPHIAGELFNLLAGVNIVAVQFKGGGPADIAALSGEVAATFGNISQEVEYVKSGRLRALAVTSATRNSALPELPTVIEAGLPGYEFLTWHGILAPKGTPAPIVKLLNEQLKKILTGPGEAKLWQDRGLDVIASSPEDFAARLVNERKKWGDVIKKRGIKAE